MRKERGKENSELSSCGDERRMSDYTMRLPYGGSCYGGGKRYWRWNREGEKVGTVTVVDGARVVRGDHTVHRSIIIHVFLLVSDLTDLTLVI